jgi:hypothetical protein
MIGKRVRIKSGYQCTREGETGQVVSFNKQTSFGNCWYILLDSGSKGSYLERYLEEIEDSKMQVTVGSRVNIVKDGQMSPARGLGDVGTVLKLSCPADKSQSGYNCWWVQIDGGSKRSYSERFLELRGHAWPTPSAKTVQEDPVDVTPDIITLCMVTEAKEKVDKAQADFVELLSRYQVQEASK